MTVRRRRLLAVVVVLLTVVAGCSGGPQNRRVEGAGSPATLSASTLDATGLGLARETDASLETRVETTVSGDVAVQAVVEVDVTTPVREYRRDGDGLVVGVVSTPAVRPIENRPQYRDPLATLPLGEQVAHAQSRYDVADLDESRVGRNVTLLGTEAPLTRATGAAGGSDVTVFVTRARDGDDFVTVVVVVPTGSEADVDVARLTDGVEH